MEYTSTTYEPTQPAYNGWTNRETWLINLWISNDEWASREVAALARRHATNPQSTPVGYLSPAYTLAAELEEWVAEQYDFPAKGIASDLLQSALSRVNWRELAEHYLVDLNFA